MGRQAVNDIEERGAAEAAGKIEARRVASILLSAKCMRQGMEIVLCRALSETLR